MPQEDNTGLFDQDDLAQAEANDRLKEFIRETEVDDIRAVLGLKRGRAFVWSLLEKAGVFRSTFAGEETHTSAFHEGRRSVGLEIFEKVFTDGPETYRMMASEAEERAKELHARARAVRD